MHGPGALREPMRRRRGFWLGLSRASMKQFLHLAWLSRNIPLALPFYHAVLWDSAQHSNEGVRRFV